MSGPRCRSCSTPKACATTSGDTSSSAKPGDWLVDNRGDVYTVTLPPSPAPTGKVGTGAYVKSAPVWAKRASGPGSVAAQEGRTDYAAGDWLVSNREDGADAYAISAAEFDKLYEVDDQQPGAP
jgi:hypothetical protein